MNQKIWDRYSELYDYFTFSIQEELLSHIASRSRGDTFDIGCGVGKLFSYLLDNPDVRHITGIDSSDEMLRLAGKNYEDEIRKKKIKLLRKDIAKMSEVEKADTITMINVLYSLKENPEETLRKIKDMLRLEGILILSNPLPGKNITTDIFSKLEKEIREDDMQRFNEFLEMNKILHQGDKDYRPKTYTTSELAEILEGIGFRIKEKDERFYFGCSTTIIAVKPSSQGPLS